MRRLQPWKLLAPAVLAVALAAPAAAVADTSGSSNWSGYAVHHNGTAFKHVSGSWRQPTGTCAAGTPTYSAFWVGLGGYAQNSAGIEQLGTEFDCTANGTPRLSAWYELLPAPVRRISIAIAPGDQVSGDVKIAGKNVTLTLSDLTRHESFSRTILDHKIDQSSAEWITEAPSQCVGTSRCKPLPLTDFGSVAFSGADVETAAGQTGSISSPLWSSTQIVLARSSAQYVSTGSSGHEASPSPLRNGGHAFSVAYKGPAPTASAPPQSKGSGGSGTVPGSSGGSTGSGGGNPGTGDPGGGYYPGGGYPGGGGWYPGGGYGGGGGWSPGGGG